MNNRVTLLIACLLACASPLYASRVELIPWFGYQVGGEFEDAGTDEDYDIDEAAAAGAIIDIGLTELTQLEFYFSRQETEVTATDTLFDLDIDYFHVGGTVLFSQDKWQPFVVGTLGVTHMDPDLSSADSENNFSIGLGGGIRFFPTERLGLYLAGRGFYTFVDTVVRGTSGSGGTTIAVRADGILQGLLQAGLVLRF